MTDDANDCGCCTGTGRPPGLRFNPPGLPALDYRIGRHGEFKAALLARLSSSAFPALAGLRTRDDDDFSIAWCDAGAMMLDVLSFYQERIANESYLRTCVERRSVIELARLIGYRPAPGVAASTHLAFTLEDAPGMPSLGAGPVTVPVGTRVQSVPGPDEQPQTFETVEAVTARVEWNAIPAQACEPQAFVFGTRDLFVAGANPQVQAGDVVLVVGDERGSDVDSDRWDARVVTGVEADNERDLTRLILADGLGHGTVNPAELGVRAYVFRLRTSLFGHNATDARMLRFEDDSLDLTTGAPSADTEWKDYEIRDNQLDLDGGFPKVLPGSWVLLAGGSGATGTPSLPGRAMLYRASKVTQISRAAYGLSGKITRIDPDTIASLGNFELDKTLVLAQSEELALISKPLRYPVYGGTIALGRRDTNLARGQALAVAGKRQRLRIVIDDAALKFKPDGAAEVQVEPGDSFRLAAAPTWLLFGEEIALPPDTLDYVLRWKPLFPLRWRLTDRDGRDGTLDALPTAVMLQPALKDDPIVSELTFIGKSDASISHNRDRTTLQLDAGTDNVYDRTTLKVCANLAMATHGEGVGEIAGSGDAALPNQRFRLKQAPLTHVSAGTPSGRAATLDVRVDGQLWTEVPSLYQRGANEHVYALSQDDEQRSTVQFGDGQEGARLGSGQDNLRLRYRKGLGVEGNVRANQLTTLLGRPLGVKAANNPAAATGGQDRESRDDARRNAPLTMLTLGRAVSVQDYTDFARSFAGIARAYAIWLPSGSSRGIHLSVAGPNGDAIASGSATHAHLTEALRTYGDPLIPLRISSYAPVQFRIKARIKPDPAFITDDVLKAAREHVLAHYAFDQRDFARQVSIDEVMAVIQAVPGVVAVDVDELYRLDPGAIPGLVARLFAYPPQLQPDGSVTAAELLTIDPDALLLEVMP